MFSKKLFWTGFLVIAFMSAAFTLTVDVGEIKSSKKINFINYTGKLTRVYTEAERRGIGAALSKKAEKSNIMYNQEDYSILHAIDPHETNGLDADIFMVLESASITHIKGLRSIISGYLETQYGYNKNNADTLAVYLTYYNAIYRSNLEYFATKYKTVVMKSINKQNAGISLRYSDWPGKTRMLIPLTSDLSKGKPDTLELSDDKVTAELRKTDDKGLTERKAMTELKKTEATLEKKEIAEEKEKIAKTKEEIKKEEALVKESKTEVERKKEAVEEKKKEIVREKETNSKIENKEERAKAEEKTTRKEDAVKKEEQAVKKDEAKVTAVEKQVEEKKADVTKKETAVAAAEEKLAQKEESVKKDEAEIKKDEAKLSIAQNPEKVEQELEKKSDELSKKEEELKVREDEVRKNQADRNIMEGRLYYLKIRQYMTEGHYTNDMMIINTATRKVDTVSSYKNIGGHKYDVSPEGVVVIGYKEMMPEGTLATRSDNKEVIVGYAKPPKASDYILILLDPTNLAPVVQGKDNVFWRSFVEIQDNSIYTIVTDGTDYFLGKFSLKLEKQSQSTVPVDPDSFISFYGDSLYINSKDKNILVLKKGDLTLIEKIAP